MIGLELMPHVPRPSDKGTRKLNHFELIFKVHDYIEDCNDKVEGTVFPITRILHAEIQKYLGENNIEPWSFMTSYRVLIALGFRYSDPNLNSPFQKIHFENFKAQILNKLV